MENLITTEGVQDLPSVVVKSKKEVYENFYALTVEGFKDSVMITKDNYNKIGFKENEPSGPLKYQLKTNKNGELKPWFVDKDYGTKKFGGGGGFKSTPKTQLEIHSASICRLVTGPLEHMINANGGLDERTVQAWENVSVKAIKMYISALKQVEEAFKSNA